MYVDGHNIQRRLSCSVDMWSVGVLFLEFVLRRTQFGQTQKASDALRSLPVHGGGGSHTPEHQIASWAASNMVATDISTPRCVGFHCTPWVSKYLKRLNAARMLPLEVGNPEAKKILALIDGCLRFLPSH